MNSGLAELSACQAALNNMLERAKRLVPEYDRKIRKNRNSRTEEIAQLENSIAFVELRSLDRLCADALSRWLPEHPELAKKWFVNEDKGFGSPEDVVNELHDKQIKLAFAINLYSALSNSGEAPTKQEADVPAPYKKLGESVRQFFSDSVKNCDIYEKNVFIMTRFEVSNKQLVAVDNAIRDALRTNGLHGHRADDRCYASDRNLWDNVCTYMFGCKYGVAVLEDMVVKEFNPNVALEYGFMRALGKPTLLLKERRFVARADILGTLWEEFDILEIEETVTAAIRRWCRDLT